MTAENQVPALSPFEESVLLAIHHANAAGGPALEEEIARQLIATVDEVETAIGRLVELGLAEPAEARS